ncbi:MAG: strawberry notch family protein [Desulfobacteraceae bacterium]
MAKRISRFLSERQLNNKYARYGHGQIIDWGILFSWADEAFGGTQKSGAWISRDAFDAMELGVNMHLLSDLDIMRPEEDLASIDHAWQIVIGLRAMTVVLPSQTKRTEEQQQLQQFSTPPHLGYIANWVCGVKKEDIVLEPSAGVGGLAVFAKVAGATVYVNELAPRRRALLQNLEFDGCYGENAEQLHNILPANIRPTAIVMNPPFSTSAGRIKSKGNKTKYAEAHLTQALLRLQENGRLVAIVGKGMALEKPTFRQFWSEIKDKYNLRANVRMPGKEYARYGTNFDNQLIVIDKNGPTKDNPIAGQVESAEDLLDLLEGVKNDRPRPHEHHRQDKPVAGQPERIQDDRTTQRADTGPLDTRHPGDTAGNRKGADHNQESAASTSARSDARQPGPGLYRSDTGTGRHGTDSGSDKPGRPGARSAGPAPDRDVRRLPEPSGIDVQIADKQRADEEISDSLYDHYQPKTKIIGTQPHPTPLVESAAMAAVDLPQPTYKPKLLKQSVESGAFSDAQIEQIIYAGQAHSDMLPGGTVRRGYMIGDGTGVGKGREIAGVLWDNWHNGRRKALWITEKPTLFKDAQRDLIDVGWTEGAEKLFSLSQKKVGRRIEVPEGLMFATYALLAREFKHIKPDVPETLENMAVRLNQIVDWLEDDFQGVIVFDECHNMANAQGKETDFGKSAASQKAMAGVLLQNLLPNARVLYVSATAATEISNFAYLERLGLWGEGTAFKSKNDFIGKIGAGGMASMELLASNMKAMGAYHARSLSWQGVEVERMVHELSPEQTDIYNQLADAWQIVLNNINEALGITGIYESGRERGAAYSRFWGAHQRFFNQVITSMQMPTILKASQKDLEDGHAVIFQLINTNEASLNRARARMQEGDEYEDIDITPRDQLMEYIQNGFPTRQYEQFEDDNGNIIVRPVFDSEGNPVINQQAVEMRDRLLEQLGGIKVPLGPLDMIINSFGHENVAEVTGRSKRIVYDEQKERKILQNRTKNNVMADMELFKDDEKQILVFSKSGNTGLSFHSDKTYKNKRPRRHYLVQPGWIAYDAIQGIGRSHRSNQAHPPHYFLCSTDLKGQKRFISSIARRLDQLGALTRGQRQTGGQGMFEANDNLENDYARQGLRRFFEELFLDKIPGLKLDQFEAQTGLSLTDEIGALKANLPPINQFLNRLLSMNIDQQNTTFAAFEEQMDEIVQAHAAAGTLDTGIKTLRAKRIDKIDDKVVFTEEKTGAQARYIQINVAKESNRVSWEEINLKKSYAFGGGFCINRQSGRIWAASNVRQKTKLNGSIIEVRNLISPTGTRQNIAIEGISDPDKWVNLSHQQARNFWQAQYNQAPSESTERRHIFTGSILPIWSHLKGPDRILRLQTSDGDRLLGREVSDQSIDETLDRLNAKRQTQALSGATIQTKVIG